MDLRSQTSLLGAVLSLAVAATVLLRPRKRRVHWLFALFDLTVSAWYGTSFLARWAHGSLFWERLNLVFAVLLPLAAVQFFRAFLLTESRRSGQLNRVALALACTMIVAVFTPLHPSLFLGTLIFTYVFVLLGTALMLVYRAGRRARSRFDGARLTYLALVGTFAAVFTLAEYLPYVGLDIPPVGTVLILVFLYVLSQSILRYRLLDLYELGGKLFVLTALSFTLAGILWVLVWLDPGNFYLHSVAAALVLLITFEPVHSWVEQRISAVFLRERLDFERLAEGLRRKLANATSLDELVRAIVVTLGESRRVTHGAVYLLDRERSGFQLAGHVGERPVGRIDPAGARAFLERLTRESALVLENVEREREERTELGDDREARALGEVLDSMRELNTSLVAAVRGETELYGFLCLRDDRLRDAYTPEEVGIVRALAAQAASTVESLRLYERLRDRDRLAALGEMAAGLAHEIRNPLGSIKASAQFLSESADESRREPGHEFLGIIVEEVDRLNRVVSSFLDYARPTTSSDEPIDPTATIERTLQLVRPELGPDLVVEVALAPALPHVRIDPERLRQVLLNLVQNATQAMDGRGTLTVRSQVVDLPDHRRAVEIAVLDTGPGLPARVRENLFVPFVTTKERGTGLGLAISQRIVSAAGGRIEARGAESGRGTMFVVRLPVHEEPRAEAQGGVAPSQSSEPSGSWGVDGTGALGPSREGAGELASRLATDR
ncbi:MAG: GAF domain-containing protein [Sandaracinaceae bacterium]|nr:GAF domain-containing protein [Sandaracinaceae bacterium]